MHNAENRKSSAFILHRCWKAFHAESSMGEIVRLLRENKPVKYTENTCTTMEEIFNKMETARECGYSTDDEECEMGMRCVAVPIRNYTGEIIAGLSVSGPTTRMTLEIFRKGSLSAGNFKKISRRLGAEI